MTVSNDGGEPELQDKRRRNSEPYDGKPKLLPIFKLRVVESEY